MFACVYQNHVILCQLIFYKPINILYMEKKQNLTKEQKEEVKSIFHDLLLSVEEQKKITGGLVTGMASVNTASMNSNISAAGCFLGICPNCTACEHGCTFGSCQHTGT